MIPDVEPDEHTLIEHLRILADLVEKGTLDPKLLQDELPVEENHTRIDNATVTYNILCNMIQSGWIDPYNSVTEVVRGVQNKPFRHSLRLEHENIPPVTNTPIRRFYNERPSLSYIDMITAAIKSSTSGRMKLKEIYKWIIDHYPYFKTSPLAWKNSVRHALSASKLFCRISDKAPWCRGADWALVDTAPCLMARIDSAVQKMNATEIYNSFHAEWYRQFDMQLDGKSSPLTERQFELMTESRSPVSDPFAMLDDDSFSQSQHTFCENLSNMPEFDFCEGNLDELVISEGLIRRRSRLNILHAN